MTCAFGSSAMSRSSRRGRRTRCRTAARERAATPTSGRAGRAAGSPCPPTSPAAEATRPWSVLGRGLPHELLQYLVGLRAHDAVAAGDERRHARDAVPARELPVRV